VERTKEYDRVLFGATSLQKILSEFKDIIVEPGKSEFGSLTIDNGMHEIFR
jgi:hypothetical protein